MATQLQRDLTTDGTGAAVEPAATTAVRARGVRRAFGERAVLDGIDLDIAAGEFVAVLGRSGTGKSTLLRVLGGLDPEFEGDVDVPERRAFVFQDPRLLPWKRVHDNVALGLHRHERSRVVEALAEVGLDGHARAFPKTLSGGEAQRAALARALVRDPQLLLLDEPFGALDALTRIRMHTLLQQLCARHDPAVVLVTHDVDEAIILADRVVVLDEGHVVVDLPVDVPTPRLRSHEAFGRLRSRLLAALGIDERAEGEHH